eukprot:CAMPEP_0176139294 /NCGR_PEP_ID=MMETSP0120_2-20121206/70772_1 /TAXON_ID=160619 /ORGANISM="Kryptoperidinium foliaceum, Strain CCMP 1326" /LENGTH=77 /DNA_ID=CAMNT_0017475277 /DNA_START=35 /DNA_END=265 /DNA_ORIENTATION=+
MALKRLRSRSRRRSSNTARRPNTSRAIALDFEKNLRPVDWLDHRPCELRRPRCFMALASELCWRSCCLSSGIKPSNA